MEDRNSDVMLEETLLWLFDELRKVEPGSDEAAKIVKAIEELKNAQTGKFRADADWASSENKREFEERIREEELAEKTREAADRKKLLNRIDLNTIIRDASIGATVLLTMLFERQGNIMNWGALKPWNLFRG